MKAQTIIDVILGEAVHGTTAERYADMLGISSVIHNRSVAGNVSPQDVVSVQSEFNAYGDDLPAGVEKYRDLAEKAWDEVRTNGPVHGARFYATEKASKNLPKGLNEVARTTGHVYYEDPKDRSFKTAIGYVQPKTDRLPESAPIPTPRPDGGAVSPEVMQMAYADPGGLGGVIDAQPTVPLPEYAPTPTTRPEPSAPRGLGMAALLPSGSMEFYNPGQENITDEMRNAVLGTSAEFDRTLGINSGYRSPEYNRSINGAQNSFHTRGQAVDIDMRGMSPDERQRLVYELKSRGVGGLGTYDRYPDMLHADMRRSPNGDVPWFMHNSSRWNMGGAPEWFQEMEAARGLYFPKEMQAPAFRDQAAPAAVVDASQTGSRGLGAMPEALANMPAPVPASASVDPILAEAYRQYGDSRVESDQNAALNRAGEHLASFDLPPPSYMRDAAIADAYRQYGDSRVAGAHAAGQPVATPVTPFPAATPPASPPVPVNVADAYRQYADSRVEGNRLAALNAAGTQVAALGIPTPVIPEGQMAPPLDSSRIVLDYPVRDVSQGPLAPPAGLGAVPIPTPRPDTTIRTPDQGPIPTPRPSGGAMGDIPIPTPRPSDTIAPPMPAARTIGSAPVAADAGLYPAAGKGYFPPAPSPTPVNSGAFDASPFWQTKSGGLGKFGGILKGAATGAAVGGLPGAVLGGVLGSGVLKKVFEGPSSGTPAAGAPSRGGYVGSGVDAMASVFSGKAPPGSLAASRSNPGTFAMSLPGGLVARSYESPTHGYITGIYGLGPDEDTNPGAKFGKVAALSPDAKSWSFVGPEEARGLQAKGWSVSIGPASKATISAPAAPANEAKAAVTAAPTPTTAKAAPAQTNEANKGLGKALSQAVEAIAGLFGLGPAGMKGPGGLGAVAAPMASPYGMTGGGMGLGGMSGVGIGNYSGAGMGGGWSEANGPAGNRA